MRHIIGVEGRQVLPNQFVELGACVWPDEAIPVETYLEQWVARLVGRATDIRREDDGTLTAEIDVEIPKGLAATLYCDGLSYDKERYNETGIMIITSCRIRSVFLSSGVPWISKKPGDHIEEWTKP